MLATAHGSIIGSKEACGANKNIVWSFLACTSNLAAFRDSFGGFLIFELARKKIQEWISEDAAILVLSAERSQLAIVRINNADFLQFGHGVGELGRHHSAPSRTVPTFLEDRKSISCDSR